MVCCPLRTGDVQTPSQLFGNVSSELGHSVHDLFPRIVRMTSEHEVDAYLGDVDSKLSRPPIIFVELLNERSRG